MCVGVVGGWAGLSPWECHECLPCGSYVIDSHVGGPMWELCHRFPCGSFVINSHVGVMSSIPMWELCHRFPCGRSHVGVMSSIPMWEFCHRFPCGRSHVGVMSSIPMWEFCHRFPCGSFVLSSQVGVFCGNHMTNSYVGVNHWVTRRTAHVRHSTEKCETLTLEHVRIDIGNSIFSYIQMCI